MGRVTSNTIAEIKMNSRWSSGSSAPMDDHDAVFTISGIPNGATNISATLWYTIKTTAATGTRYLTFNGVAGYHRVGTSSVSLGSLGNGTHTVVIEFQPYGSSDYTQSVLMLYDVYIVVDYTEPASSWTIPSSVNLGSSLGVTITNMVSGRTHSWQLTFGSNTSSWQSMAANVTTSSMTVPLGWASVIPNATSGTGTVTFRTQDSSGNVLSTDAKSITLVVPSTASTLPTAGTLTLTVNAGYNGLCLQGRSTVTATLSGSSGKYGAAIASISIRGGGYSSSSSPMTTGLMQTAGSIPFTATVTDTRGRSANATTVYQTVTAYEPPTVLGAAYYRSNANYEADPTGTNLSGKVEYTWTQLEGTAITMDVLTKASDSTVWTTVHNDVTPTNGAAFVIGSGYSVESVYNVRYVLTDGISTATAEGTVPMGYVFGFFDKDNKRLSFGSYPKADSNNMSLADDWTFHTHGSEILDLIKAQAAVVDAAAGYQNASQVTNAMLSKVYPVGSIYLSTSSTSPASFLGGTWQRLYDRFLVGCGNSYGSGATGGEANVTLSATQVPRVTGGITMHNGGSYTDIHTVSGCFSGTTVSAYQKPGSSSTGATSIGTITFDNGGQGAAHNNMPPYLAVYMWQRTA